jgi:lipopolysaccharide biosynthesis regulator YciM
VSELIAGTDGQRAADRFLDEAMRRHPRHKALIRMLHVDLVAPDDGEEAEG